MVIMTAKVSKRKILAIVLVVILAIILLSALLRNSGSTEETAQNRQLPAAQEIKTNEDRVAYLEALGWQVKDEPVQTQEVRVPTEPSEVFTRYNELQKSQGFDLDKLAGKCVRRYVYEIENYPEGTVPYFATILVYKDQVVGGDVCSSEKGGMMHGLQMPKKAATAVDSLVEELELGGAEE